MTTESAIFEQYKTVRSGTNYTRFFRFVVITLAIGLFFIIRNLYSAFVKAQPHPEYLAVYLFLLVFSLIFIVLMPVVKRKLSAGFTDKTVAVSAVTLFFSLTHLSLLDSFDFNAYDFTAYLFGCVMFSFFLRVDLKFNLLILFSGMAYFLILYIILRPDIFNLMGMLPMFGISAFSFYFSYTREKIEYRLFIADIKLKDKNRELEEYALYDKLTGLYNRRYLDEFLERQIAGFNRHGKRFSIIFADLDNFKDVNDNFGHMTGDSVLREFAGILKQGSRDADISFRYGGEEFLLIITESGLAEASEIAERIRKATEAFEFTGLPGRQTSSFGVAEIRPGDDLAGLISRADENLYSAKRNGRNRCCSIPVKNVRPQAI